MGIKISTYEIRIKIKGFYEDRLRQVIYAAIPLIMFGFFSQDLFLENKPDWFSRLGSLMIVWAIINITIKRAHNDAVKDVWREQRIIKHINQIRRIQDLRTRSLDLSFDRHELMIAQINLKLRKSKRFPMTSPLMLKRFDQSIRSRLNSTKTQVEFETLLTELQEFEETYKDAVPSIISWSKMMYSVETILIVVGTIQWGYGGLLVDWYHS